MNVDFTPLEKYLSNESIRIRCPDEETALALHRRLIEAQGETNTFHVEHRPNVDHKTGEISSWSLQIRRLHFDRSVGWTSADIPDEPDFVVSGNEELIEQTEVSKAWSA
jgi:hypothetical protein